MAEARGYWIKAGERVDNCLLWIIDGEFVTDGALRRWWRAHAAEMNSGLLYIGPCVLKYHTDAYANRNK